VFQGYFTEHMNITLTGRGGGRSLAAGARFGSAIESMGDINMDGYKGKCVQINRPRS
jgi:hypothetical protein